MLHAIVFSGDCCQLWCVFSDHSVLGTKLGVSNILNTLHLSISREVEFLYLYSFTVALSSLILVSQFPCLSLQNTETIGMSKSSTAELYPWPCPVFFPLNQASLCQVAWQALICPSASESFMMTANKSYRCKRQKLLKSLSLSSLPPVLQGKVYDHCLIAVTTLT